ncbi:hypothetical protein C0Q70_06890 [Pomacea canaliculata]|uniref:Uncharacterized protein n=1 Tax=Pomacea canaliculata TaxID=400727 RepID=A0A2T7PDI5_POMCA|nr:hypothetical protein C0Q70_06890 [Pomacea canaliculata]
MRRRGLEELGGHPVTHVLPGYQPQRKVFVKRRRRGPQRGRRPQRVGLVHHAAAARRGGGTINMEALDRAGESPIDLALAEAVGIGRGLHELQGILRGCADEAVAFQHLATFRAPRDGREDSRPLAVGSPGRRGAEGHEPGHLLPRRGVDGGDATHSCAQRQRLDRERQDAAGVTDVLQLDPGGEDADEGQDPLDVVVVIHRVALSQRLLDAVQPVAERETSVLVAEPRLMVSPSVELVADVSEAVTAGHGVSEAETHTHARGHRRQGMTNAR